ncbi:MAG: gliding motility-associated protein GldE [Lentimicrobiaceae bacterium]|nr:gliding motility-associated protein GldE [Lentimicrobiaceae bacterium]
MSLESIYSYNNLTSVVSLGIIFLFILLPLLLFASALISACEVAFFSLSPSQLKSIRTNENPKDDVIVRLLDKPKLLLATILICNNFINITFVILSTLLGSEIFHLGTYPVLEFIVQVVIITSLILLFAEILPKVFAARYSLHVAHFMAQPLQILVKIIYPLSWLLVSSSNLIDHRLVKKGITISKDELSKAIELTADENSPEGERKMLEGIVKFGDIEVKEIMKARIDVTAINTELSFEEVLKVILDSGYSRIPVYTDSIDNISGILYTKDLLPYLDKSHDNIWLSLVRPAYFVPENKKINDLLSDFQEKKIHMAIVVDEYGGTSGIVTFEDIIEEIVGEISDELDTENDEIRYQQIDENTYIFEAKTSLNDFYKILNISDTTFDKYKGDSDTLAGLILEHSGQIPEKGFSLKIDEYLFTIEASDKRRIKKIKVVYG